MMNNSEDSQQLKEQFNQINRRLEILRVKFVDITTRAKELIRAILGRQDARQIEDVRKRIGLD